MHSLPAGACTLRTAPSRMNSCDRSAIVALHRMDMAAKCEPRSRRLRNASRKSWPHAEAAAAAAATSSAQNRTVICTTRHPHSRTEHSASVRVEKRTNKSHPAVREMEVLRYSRFSNSAAALSSNEISYSVVALLRFATPASDRMAATGTAISGLASCSWKSSRTARAANA